MLGYRCKTAVAGVDVFDGHGLYTAFLPSLLFVYEDSEGTFRRLLCLLVAMVLLALSTALHSVRRSAWDTQS